MISKDPHGGCLFFLAPPRKVAKGIQSIYGVPMTGERILAAAHRTHLLGFALEQRQGAEPDDYGMPEEIFVGSRKGDLPGAHVPGVPGLPVPRGERLPADRVVTPVVGQSGTTDSAVAIFSTSIPPAPSFASISAIPSEIAAASISTPSGALVVMFPDRVVVPLPDC